MEDDEFYMEAFWELGTCRNSGFGIGCIPYTAIRTYAVDDKKLPEDLYDVFRQVIRELDEVFLAWHNDEAEAKAKAKSNGG